MARGVHGNCENVREKFLVCAACWTAADAGGGFPGSAGGGSGAANRDDGDRDFSRNSAGGADWNVFAGADGI